MLPEQARFPTPAIDALLSALPKDLLSDNPRLYVATDVLLESDRALCEVEMRHRANVLLECKEIYFKCLKILHEESDRKASDALRSQHGR
jgi:hypothetical protein